MQMNFFIALRASRGALTAMVEQGTRAIVKVASVNAFFQREPPRSTTAPPRPHWSTSPRRCPRNSARALSVVNAVSDQTAKITGANYLIYGGLIKAI